MDGCMKKTMKKHEYVILVWNLEMSLRSSKFFFLLSFFSYRLLKTPFVFLSPSIFSSLLFPFISLSILISLPPPCSLP